MTLTIAYLFHNVLFIIEFISLSSLANKLEIITDVQKLF